MEKHMQEEIYLVPEFCQCFKISRTSLYREVKARRLNIIKRGRRTLITRQDAEAWLEKLRAASEKQADGDELSS